MPFHVFSIKLVFRLFGTYFYSPNPSIFTICMEKWKCLKIEIFYLILYKSMILIDFVRVLNLKKIPMYVRKSMFKIPMFLKRIIRIPPLLRKQEPRKMNDAGRKKSAIEEIIMKYGYDVEPHRITTADGYILKAFRIPRRKSQEIENPTKKVVWLQHGFLSSAMDWVLLNEKSLAFLLSDSGYDVWLGNARGNRHSRRHVSIDPNKGPFWDFSFHEMGKFDVPAIIDYVLKATGVEDLFWIGHSMGNTMFFIGMIENPEYNKKVKFMVAAAPAVFVHNMKSPLALVAPYAEILTCMKELLPVPAFPRWLPQWVVYFVGKTFIEPLFKGNKMQIKENTSLFLSQFPAGSSTKTLLHYAQALNLKTFEKYNYGERKNMELYGSKAPPHYDFSLITVPVAMFYGDNDIVVNIKDVTTLASKITNLVSVNRVERDQFDHMDFIIAPDAPTILYGKIISLMNATLLTPQP